MKAHFLRFSLFGFVVLLLAACSSEPEAVSTTPTVDNIPSFNRDSAYNYIQQQVDMGPRDPGSEGHKQVTEWLVTTLAGHGAEVMKQPFTTRLYDNSVAYGNNVIGSYYPDRKHRILLCAHFDTRRVADYDPNESRQNEPILGADDGGSGVGVLMEIARIINQEDPGVGVDIVFFDIEDQGNPGDDHDVSSWCLGSQHWGSSPHVPGYKARFGILLDMVGHKNARFMKEGVSMQYAPYITNRVWEIATQQGYGRYFDPGQTGPLTDDHYYVNTLAGIPTIDIIHVDPNTGKTFGPHWHTHDDNMDIISKSTLKAVGQTVLTTLWYESGGAF